AMARLVLAWICTTVEKSFKDAGLVVEIAPFGGECSQNEIDRLRGIAETAQCGATLGIGRGDSRCDRYRNTHEMCQCFGSI
ncbi:hypothetical protein ACUOFC_63525, partial [Escherichia sp. TWPC-MK]